MKLPETTSEPPVPHPSQFANTGTTVGSELPDKVVVIRVSVVQTGFVTTSNLISCGAVVDVAVGTPIMDSFKVGKVSWDIGVLCGSGMLRGEAGTCGRAALLVVEKLMGAFGFAGPSSEGPPPVGSRPVLVCFVVDVVIEDSNPMWNESGEGDCFGDTAGLVVGWVTVLGCFV